jgi:hypothetical protein
VLLLLTLAALGARELPGTERSPRFAFALNLLDVMTFVVGLSLLVGFVLLLLTAPKPEDSGRWKARPGRVGMLGLLLVMAVAAMVILAVSAREPVESEEQAPALAGRSENAALPVEQVGSAWVIVVLAGAVVLVGAGITATRWRPQSIVDGPTPDEVVAQALDTALAELHSLDDPRAVVIRAYATIEASLADIGMPRKVSEAPREYLSRVLADVDIEPCAITRLTGLFEHARFSDHVIGSVDGREALASMEAARSCLPVPVR